MSKKTNAEKKRKAPKRSKRQHIARKGRRPNATGRILSGALMEDVVGELMWGQFGCAILRALGLRPIEVAAAIQSRANSEGLAGTGNSESPDGQDGEKAEE